MQSKGNQKQLKAEKWGDDMSKVKLTDRQLKAILHIVSSSTYTEGCKKAKINKDDILQVAQRAEV